MKRCCRCSRVEVAPGVWKHNYNLPYGDSPTKYELGCCAKCNAEIQGEIRHHNKPLGEDKKK
jgi:hypothetical protein